MRTLNPFYSRLLILMALGSTLAAGVAALLFHAVKWTISAFNNDQAVAVVAFSGVMFVGQIAVGLFRFVARKLNPHSHENKRMRHPLLR